MRKGFIYFCKNNGVEGAFQQYDNGVSAIEKEFEVSADLEFAKDKCRSLLERVKQSVESSKDSGDSIGNRKNYLTYLNKYIDYKSSLSINYWMFSPGKKAKNWVSDFKNGTISTGFTDAGDFSQYRNIEEVRDKVYEGNNYANNPETIMNFRSIKAGDVVFARKGTRSIIGFGIVKSDYKYNPERGEYPNYYEVDWIEQVDCPYDLEHLKGRYPPTVFRIDGDNLISIATAVSSCISKNNTEIETVCTYEMEQNESSFELKSNADLSSSYDYLDACPGGANLIVYGTPGCGKSYFVDHTKLGKNSNGEYVGDYNKDGIFRTTFFLDYSNTDFVGQIVPVIEYEEDGRSKIDYRFVPGPFTNALEYAIANPKKKTALVIEELNRGNAPSIFGDLFQLLDRIDVEGKGYPVGTSEYGIINTSILNYLKDKDHYDKKYQYLFELDEIRIPANLNIYATMNTSDQNVFTLDTAFKRRWDFLKLKNEFINHGYRKYIVPGMDGITWESFVTDINRFIEEDNDLLTSEDKQIGVFFVSKKMLINPSEEYDDITLRDITEKFAFKVFEYLWDDVAKFSRDKWFGDIKSLDKLIDSYISNGEQVFKNGLFKQSNHS